MPASSAESGNVSTVYLGPEASYTHQASLKIRPHDHLQPLESIAQVFSTVQNSTTTLNGVVPVENSTNGPVAATLDLLADSPGTLHAIRIIGETRVPVRHCLLGRRDPTVPAPPHIPRFGTPDAPSLAHLTRLRTHPQAWTQCSRFLQAYGLTPPGKGAVAAGAGSRIECVDASSTSSAAAEAAGDVTGRTGAISSALAAEAHGVDILMDGLEDSEHNYTRFLVLGREGQGKDGRGHGQGQAARRLKAMVTFTLAPSDPRRPGALSDTLGVFGRHDINLTSINSRPRGQGVPWEYCFLVELDLGWDDDEGKKREEAVSGLDTGSWRLNGALKDLDGVVGEWRWKGTWNVDE